MMQTNFDALWDYEHPERTAIIFRQLLPQVEQAGDRSYLLQLLTQIARTQSLQRHFSEAHALLDRVQAQLAPDLVLPTIRYALERGRTYNSAGHADEARPLFQQAWEVALAHGEIFYAVDAAHMLAIVSAPEEALTWNLKALQMAESASDERARRWNVSLYNNIAWTYHDQGDYQRALEMFQKALACCEGQGDNRKTLIARWSVARALRSLQRVEEALALQLEIHAAWQLSEENEDGYGIEEIAECLLALAREEEARPYFAQAYALLVAQDGWLVEHEPERLARLERLGQGA